MKMMPSPRPAIARIAANRPSTSPRRQHRGRLVEDQQRAPRYSALRISSRCCSPTPATTTSRSGSSCRPKLRPISARRASAAGAVEPAAPARQCRPAGSRARCSRPARWKCWCTMPMPAASASAGLRIADGLARRPGFRRRPARRRRTGCSSASSCRRRSRRAAPGSRRARRRGRPPRWRAPRRSACQMPRISSRGSGPAMGTGNPQKR